MYSSSSCSAIRAVFMLVQFCLFVDVHGVPNPAHLSSFNNLGDKIDKLPGQPKVGFQQFSGYVSVADKKQKSLFYYFVEAEVEPASKPLVLWLNGGPGCSSVGVGAFSENGPFRPQGNVLIRNEYSWNKGANMLYLETPTGVGFSYSIDNDGYDAVNDTITARDNLIFLQRWFSKFPQYKQRDLFIIGESYAGHYIPQLAKLMVQFNKKEKIFSLKGIALGNPVLEFATDFNSRVECFWSHGLISDLTYKVFSSACNYLRYLIEYHRGSVPPLCSKVTNLVNRETSNFVDKYGVTLDVCISSVFSQSKIIRPQGQTGESIDICLEDETTNYLNRQEVQKALHARLVNVSEWAVSARNLLFPTLTIDCFDKNITIVLHYDSRNVEVPTITIVGSLVQHGIPVMVYSGDQDSVIPLTGSQSLVHQLAQKLRLNTAVPYGVWFAGEQVGGCTEAYGNVLSFAIVRRASHEAPFSQPERSLVLFKSFLEGRSLPEMLWPHFHQSEIVKGIVASI